MMRGEGGFNPAEYREPKLFKSEQVWVTDVHQDTNNMAELKYYDDGRVVMVEKGHAERDFQRDVKVEGDIITPIGNNAVKGDTYKISKRGFTEEQAKLANSRPH